MCSRAHQLIDTATGDTMDTRATSRCVETCGTKPLAGHSLRLIVLLVRSNEWRIKHSQKNEIRHESNQSPHIYFEELMKFNSEVETGLNCDLHDDVME